MKDRLQKPFMVLALVVSIILTLAPIGIANAQGPLISTQEEGRVAAGQGRPFHSSPGEGGVHHGGRHGRIHRPR